MDAPRFSGSATGLECAWELTFNGRQQARVQQGALTLSNVEGGDERGLPRPHGRLSYSCKMPFLQSARKQEAGSEMEPASCFSQN